jgi:hypothetical protein
MKVGVLFERTGRVREAFRAEGHDAWSVDLQPAEDGSTYHIQDDVANHLTGWDLVIAHPPCTLLSKAGARWMHPGGKPNINPLRYNRMLEAREMFFSVLNCDAPMICVENPTPLSIAGLPAYDQKVQPWMFGDPWTKRTLLWLKGLPYLSPTDIVHPRGSWVPSNTGGASRNQKKQAGESRSRGQRSETFQGMAKAMASQWGNEWSS